MKKVFNVDQMTYFSMQKLITPHIEKSKTVPKEKSKKKGKGGFQALKILSPVLAEVCGSDKLARTKVVKQLWVYIKVKFSLSLFLFFPSLNVLCLIIA